MSRKALLRCLAGLIALAVTAALVAYYYERHQRAEMIEANMRWAGECGAYGTITHRLTGRTLTIENDADLALFEIEVVANFKPAPNIPDLTMYTLKVFAYDDRVAHEGQGFELSFTGQENSPLWDVQGSVYGSYEPDGDGLQRLVEVMGRGSGLNFDGSGGNVEVSLDPTHGGLAANYDVDLVIACR